MKKYIEIVALIAFFQSYTCNAIRFDSTAINDLSARIDRLEQEIKEIKQKLDALVKNIESMSEQKSQISKK